MDSHAQVFFDFFTTFRALLRSPPSIDFTKELSSLPTNILNDASKLTKCSVKHVFPKHTLGAGTVIQIFHEHHITSVTKRVGLFVVEVLPSVVNFVVKQSNFKALFLVIFRPLMFSTQSTLQQFQLALQLLKKLGRLYEYTVTSCQKLLQPNINPNRMTVRDGVRNTDIALQGDRCVPSVCFPQYSYLLDHKSRRDRSMQIDGNCSNLGQFNMQVRYWILLELGKQQRLELTVLLESGKAKSSFLEIFPTSMQLLDSLLENLGRNFSQLWEFLLRSWQVVELLNLTGKLKVRRKNVFFLQRASINQTLPTVTPILYLPQRIVKCTATDFHPLNQCLLLSGIWIDSVTVGECQHSSNVENLLVTGKNLNVNFTGL